MSTYYTAMSQVPSDTPRIGLKIKLINGVPVLFSERDECVLGVQRCTVIADMEEATTCEVRLLLVRE